MATLILVEIDLFIIGTFCVFASFSVSKTKREHIDSKIETFISFLKNSSITQVVQHDANKVVNAINKIYSENLFSGKSFVKAIFISTIILWLVAIMLTGYKWIVPALQRDYGGEYYSVSGDVFLILLFIYPVNAVLDLLSISITKYFMLSIAKSQEIFRIINLLLYDMIIAAVLIFVPITVIGLPQGMRDYKGGLNDLISFPNVFLSGEKIPVEMGIVVAISISPILPTTFHLLYLLYLSILKALHPILKGIIAFVLRKSAEHEKSLLAIIGVFLIFLSQVTGFIQKIM